MVCKFVENRSKPRILKYDLKRTQRAKKRDFFLPFDPFVNALFVRSHFTWNVTLSRSKCCQYFCLMFMPIMYALLWVCVCVTGNWLHCEIMAILKLLPHVQCSRAYSRKSVFMHIVECGGNNDHLHLTFCCLACPQATTTKKKAIHKIILTFVGSFSCTQAVGVQSKSILFIATNVTHSNVKVINSVACLNPVDIYTSSARYRSFRPVYQSPKHQIQATYISCDAENLKNGIRVPIAIFNVHITKQPTTMFEKNTQHSL